MTIEKQQSTECVEPYGWVGENSGQFIKNVGQGIVNGKALFTSPQRKPWVGLTDNEKKEIERLSVYVEGAIRHTEAKLKEKNDF